MLAELSVVEQRYLAVREALDTGATITDVATRYGVDRRTVHRWLLRYATGGLGALADRSSKPDRCPHQIPRRSKPRSCRCEGPTPGWGLGVARQSVHNWLIRYQARRPPSPCPTVRHRPESCSHQISAKLKAAI